MVRAQTTADSRAAQALGRHPGAALVPPAAHLQVVLRVLHQALHDFLHGQGGADAQLRVRLHLPPHACELRRAGERGATAGW